MAGGRDNLRESASQTAGPYVHIGLAPGHAGLGGIYGVEPGRSTFEAGAAGEVVTITGRVLDGTGWALRDALIEAWQADAGGLYAGQAGADPRVGGFARICADAATGEWTLRTIKPGRVPHPAGGTMAPHVALWIVARGINVGLQTRLYFEDERNEGDPVLARIEHKHRVPTLIATRTGPGAYRFDIRLQGEGETVFFDM
ncbi:protocatechuate 3,4-dioxygenase subunit alpha [Wenxinia saemankumensis]|uniref:Protocatechuate 3,4-dioxygenase, alpha subunit n=1 Tax=Wenxinia saemankumensis TaxID=1447782 RepID=A0A1M6AA95_9RHOB|nr:protocatechuate 3,4-dioxygenase subunit alpha [Wenxinia saemankumensis]SHI33392.1 protocatechuate 3,4-dioxygenase, alpha subunit [Wenxinia saemankumensis]